MIAVLLAGLCWCLAGCGGGCTRNTDCHSDSTCRAGTCVLLPLPDAGLDGGSGDADSGLDSMDGSPSGDGDDDEGTGDGDNAEQGAPTMPAGEDTPAATDDEDAGEDTGSA